MEPAGPALSLAERVHRLFDGTGEGDQQVEIELDRAANVVHSVTPLEAGS